mgnify:FL=1
MKVLCGRAAALFAGGDFGDYQNVRAITEPDGGVKKFLYVLGGQQCYNYRKYCLVNVLQVIADKRLIILKNMI